MFGYVYLTTNLITGKKYIGRHKSSNYDSKYYGSGSILESALKKYGRKNFSNTVIEECNSEEELNNREKFGISYYDAVDSDDFYNIAQGGFGYTGNKGLTKETNETLKAIGEKESKTKKEKYKNRELVPGNKNLTKETSESIKKYSEKLSISKKGTKGSDKRRNAQPNVKGECNGNYGHYGTDEQKKAQSTKLKEIKKNKSSGNAKKVLCIETGSIYKSLHEVEDLIKLDRKKVSRCCKNAEETCGGYHGKYAE